MSHHALNIEFEMEYKDLKLNQIFHNPLNRKGLKGDILFHIYQ